MKKIIYSTFVFIIFFALISCSTTDSNEEKEIPDFVLDLKQKPQVPDSVDLELVPNVTSISEDTLSLNILMINHGISSIKIAHASNFARPILYKDSNLVYPDPDKLDSYISYGDRQELSLSSKDTVQVSRWILPISKDQGLKIMVYSVQKIILIDSVKHTLENDLWLLSKSKKIN